YPEPRGTHQLSWARWEGAWQAHTRARIEQGRSGPHRQGGRISLPESPWGRVGPHSVSIASPAKLTAAYMLRRNSGRFFLGSLLFQYSSRLWTCLVAVPMAQSASAVPS